MHALIDEVNNVKYLRKHARSQCQWMSSQPNLDCVEDNSIAVMQTQRMAVLKDTIVSILLSLSISRVQIKVHKAN